MHIGQVQNNIVLQYKNTELGVCHVRYLTDIYQKLPEAAAKKDMLQILNKVKAMIKAIP